MNCGFLSAQDAATRFRDIVCTFLDDAEASFFMEPFRSLCHVLKSNPSLPHHSILQPVIVKAFEKQKIPSLLQALDPFSCLFPEIVSCILSASPAWVSIPGFSSLDKAYEHALQFFGAKENALSQEHLSTLVTLIRTNSTYLSRAGFIFFFPRLLCHLVRYGCENLLYNLDCVQLIRNVWDCLDRAVQTKLLLLDD